MKKILTVLLLVFTTTAMAEKKDNFDYIYVDSQYTKGIYQSMSSIHRLGGTYNLMNRGIFKYSDKYSDKLGRKIGGNTSKSAKVRRAANLWANFALNKYIMYEGYAIIVHEHSHLTSQLVMGTGYGYNPTFSSNGVARMYQFLARRITGGGIVWADAKNGKDSAKPFIIDESSSGINPFNMHVNSISAGFNSEHTFAAQLMEESRHNNNVNVADFPTYFLSSFSIYNYSLGDTEQDPPQPDGDRSQLIHAFKLGEREYHRKESDGKYITFYKTKDEWKYDFKDGDMARYEMIAFALSASTYNYLYSAKNYIDKGNLQSERLLHKIPVIGIYYPDTETYVTDRGLSLRVVSGYEINKKTTVPFSYEKVVKGQKDEREYGLGLIHKFNDKITLDSKYFFGSKGGSSSRSKIKYHINDNLMTFIELQQQNLNSLDSLRFVYMTKKAKSTLTTVGLAYRF